MHARIKIITAMLIFGSIGAFVRNINLSSSEIAFLRGVIGSIFLICAGFFLRQGPSYKSIKRNIPLLTLAEYSNRKILIFYYAIWKGQPKQLELMRWNLDNRYALHFVF